MAIRIMVPMDEALWRRLRDVAEGERVNGRASVSAVVLRALEERFLGVVSDKRATGTQHKRAPVAESVPT